MTTGDDELVVEVTTDEAGLDALRTEWNEAAAASLDPNVFLTWEWLRTWWRHFGEGRVEARLHVVTVRDDAGLVAAAPLFRSRTKVGPFSAWVLRPISYDAGDYGGFLLVRRQHEAIDKLTDHLAGQLAGPLGTGPQTISLSRLPSDSTLLTHLSDRADRQGTLQVKEIDLGDACPYADVRDGYNLNRHLKKHKVRQRMRRLSEKHEVTFGHHTGDSLDDGLEALVDLHRRRWDDRQDDFQGLLADSGQEAFLLDAIRALDSQGWLQLLTLRADGRPVAVELDFCFARRVYMFKGTFDPDFAEFSPGQLAHYRVFEDGIAAGVQEFDFLRGDHPYKRRWANNDRRLITLTLTRSGVAGRLSPLRTRFIQAAQRRLSKK